MNSEKLIPQGIIHFIGIGGIGMSGIAELMKNQGYQVQGSDLSLNSNIERLKKKKIKVFLKHKPSNLKKVSLVVFSSAIKKTNPEILESKKLKLPIISRAEILGELMRYKQSIAVAGSHGKTTTTSLIGLILEKGKKDPTIVNGGIIKSFSNNYRLGLGKWMVVEADESDGSFLKLPHQINIITNIDYEHLDYYKDIETLISTFEDFVNKIPFYGFSIICTANKLSSKLAQRIRNKKVITYDYQNRKADVNITKIISKKNYSFFSINIKKNIFKKYYGKHNFILNLHGKHNVLNATASIITGFLLNIPKYKINLSLKKFEGVNRRFTYLGKIGKSKIYDDYAHHPTEIDATYKIARIISTKKIIVIFQPHRFSRTKALYKSFLTTLNKIDTLFIADIYPAGEKKIKNINSLKIVRDITKLKQSKNKCYYLKSQKDLNKYLKPYFYEENLIIFMGAGTITHWAKKFFRKNESFKI